MQGCEDRGGGKEGGGGRGNDPSVKHYVTKKRIKSY